jgi:hypothetical protein
MKPPEEAPLSETGLSEFDLEGRRLAAHGAFKRA